MSLEKVAGVLLHPDVAIVIVESRSVGPYAWDRKVFFPQKSPESKIVSALDEVDVIFTLQTNETGVLRTSARLERSQHLANLGRQRLVSVFVHDQSSVNDFTHLENLEQHFCSSLEGFSRLGTT